MVLGDRPENAVVAVIRKENKFLGIKRAASVRAPGKICFPGGGVQAGETELEALVRELREELGVLVRPIRKVWQSVTPWGVQVGWYTAALLTEQFAIDANEVEWFRWMETSDFLDSPDVLVSNAHFFEALASGEFTLE